MATNSIKEMPMIISNTLVSNSAINDRNSLYAEKVIKVLSRLKNNITVNASIDIKLKDWAILTDLIRSYHQKPIKNNYSLFLVMDNLFKALSMQKNIRVIDSASLKKFLSKFSKIEAIYILQLYIQTYTNPYDNNNDFISPAKFSEGKTGDCNDVAWFNNDVLASIGIKTKIIEINFDNEYTKKYNVGTHAAVQFDIEEKGKQYYGFIDNENVYLSRSLFTAALVHKTYPQADEYREIDPEIWRAAGCETCDKTRNNYYNFTQIKLIYRSKALRLFGDKIPFEDVFMNPKDDVLYFKKNANRIILNRKDIPYKEREVLMYLYYRSDKVPE